MDVRRVQITGGSSFMVTLPKTWADSVGLKKNDPVMLSPLPNGGLLLSVGSGQPSEIDYGEAIDVDSVLDGDALYRRLIGAYIAGHNPITVFSKQPIRGGMLEPASKFTQTFIGMEIVEEDESCIVMRDLIDQTEIQPQKNVRREHLLVKRMVSDVFLTAEDGDFERIAAMADRDIEVDRIHWLIQRQSSIHQMDVSLCSRMGLNLRQVTGCVLVSKSIERMGDHAVLVAGCMRDLQGTASEVLVRKAMMKFGAEMAPLFGEAVNAWMNGDIDAAEECVRRAKSLGNRAEAVFNIAGISPDSVNAASTVAGSCRRLAEYCADIAESAINSAMERQ